MNNTELEKLLKTAQVPERTPDFWDKFPKTVSAKIQWQAHRAASADVGSPRERKHAALLWGLGLASACIVVGFAIGFWRGRATNETGMQLAQVEKCFREIEGMFPNQVRAIVFDRQGTRLILADKADVPQSSPLYVKVCGAGGCQSFVTFSGQELQIAGERVEVLADAHGGVMLVGNKLFWDSTESKLAADHLHIQAQALGYSM